MQRAAPDCSIELLPVQCATQEKLNRYSFAGSIKELLQEL